MRQIVEQGGPVALRFAQQVRDFELLGGFSPTCLLYTSDAADERSSVDLGGRRIIKKKKHARDRTKRMLTKQHRRRTDKSRTITTEPDKNT